MFAKPASDLPYNFSGPYLTFEAVTLVPFEPKLIKTELLSNDQVASLGDKTLSSSDQTFPLWQICVCTSTLQGNTASNPR